MSAKEVQAGKIYNNAVNLPTQCASNVCLHTLLVLDSGVAAAAALTFTLTTAAAAAAAAPVLVAVQLLDQSKHTCRLPLLSHISAFTTGVLVTGIMMPTCGQN